MWRICWVAEVTPQTISHLKNKNMTELMDCTRMASLLSCSECSPTFCFTSARRFCYESGDGKGCLGVSQDTPSAWGRCSCQPGHPLPASLRSLWLRFKQNTELKQKEKEGTSALLKAPVPNCITKTFSSEGQMIWCLFPALKTHTCVYTQTYTGTLSPELGFWGCFTVL